MSNKAFLNIAHQYRCIAASFLYFIFLFTKAAASASDNCPMPPNYPNSINLKLGEYENWASAIKVSNLWIATPANSNDVVVLANWAYKNGYKLRPSGHMHNWSPLTVTAMDSNCPKIVLVNTIQYLNRMSIKYKAPNANVESSSITVQTGASMLDLLTFLEKNGLGMYATPAPGDVTVGGVLAIGGHGTGIPAAGESVPKGHAFGTLSNLVITFDAVVWNTVQNAYVIKTFKRSETHAKAFLVNLGRTFLTEITLMVGPNYNLRCQSRTDISANELFAKPTAATTNSNTQTFDKFLDQSGRVEAIWYPFTDFPWLKVWSVTPTKPLFSRAVTTPFNYPFSDNIDKNLALTAANVTKNGVIDAQAFGLAQYAATVTGLVTTLSFDLWGPSKNLLLYVKPTTLRVTANGYAVITRRANIQNVIYTFTNYYKLLLNQYAQQKRYPINGPVEIRVTSLDVQKLIKIQSQSPSLSALHPVPAHPEFDVAVWLDILSFPNTPDFNECMEKMETFLFSTFNGNDAMVRVEWSKGWAYTGVAAWANTNVLRKLIPSTFPSDQTGQDGWNWTITILNKYDPNLIFSNRFLDALLKKS